MNRAGDVQFQDEIVIRIAVLSVSGMALVGLATLGLIEDLGLSRLAHNVAFVLYLQHELLPLLLCTTALLSLWIALKVIRPSAGNPAPIPGATVWAVALASTTLAGLGVHVVMHNFALSMDEYLALWQSEAIRQVSIAGQIPTEWQRYADAITPIYVSPGPDGSWTSQYLPVHSALLALAELFHAGWLLSPLLTGVAVIAAAGAASRLLPNQPGASAVAALLLATSAQFQVTGMTYYSWQAHLAFNLVWLWLFLSPRISVFSLAPILGVLAMGLHRPHVHILFALPFIARLILNRDWPRVAIAAVTYLAGGAFWLFWMANIQIASTATAGNLGLPTLLSLTSRLMNLGQLVTWQNIATLIFAAVALLRWKHLPDGIRNLAFGAGITFLTYLFFGGSGGHGWGARYLHSVIGNLALLGAAGLTLLPSSLWRQARVVFTTGTLLALGMLAFRLVQTEGFVRPFADASRAIGEIDADVVVIHQSTGWYLQDLVRNDPYVTGRPVLARLEGLTSGINSFPGRTVRHVDQQTLAHLGIKPRDFPHVPPTVQE